MLTLVLWGLASVHCQLETVAGLDFLKSCCLVDTAHSPSPECEDDECPTVEEGKYRSEERTDSAPQPLFFLARLSPALEVPVPEFWAASFLISESPPELSKVWQFSHRLAPSPRAPSLAA
jgi:hypothetical protein